MSGTFGYELDLHKLSDEDLEEIKAQVAHFKEIEPIVHNGLFYRLSSMKESERYFAWQFVSPEKDRSLLNIVVTDPLANSTPIHVKPKGLDPEALYRVMLKTLRSGGVTNPFKQFWLGFKTSFLQSTAVWVVYALLMVAGYFGLRICWQAQGVMNYFQYAISDGGHEKTEEEILEEMKKLDM